MRARLGGNASSWPVSSPKNEFRRNFTKSERIAIGKALEAEAGRRQGLRTDKAQVHDSITIKLGEIFPKFVASAERGPVTWLRRSLED